MLTRPNGCLEDGPPWMVVESSERASNFCVYKEVAFPSLVLDSFFLYFVHHPSIHVYNIYLLHLHTCFSSHHLYTHKYTYFTSTVPHRSKVVATQGTRLSPPTTHTPCHHPSPTWIAQLPSGTSSPAWSKKAPTTPSSASGRRHLQTPTLPTRTPIPTMKVPLLERRNLGTRSGPGAGARV